MGAIRHLLARRLNWLLLLAPLAVAFSAARAPATVTLITAALAIIPLAGLLGEAIKRIHFQDSVSSLFV